MDGDSTPLLDAWRQGDLYLAPVELPVLALDGEETVWAAMNAPHGVMIISQSCDIVRAIEDRPFVTVAVLIPATPEEVERAKRMETPSRLFSDILSPHSLLVDLDATATVHKCVVACWAHTPGCTTDEQRRKIGAALARHRQRFAFPDNFNRLVVRVRRWIEGKRNKASPQGNFVRAMEEVRVYCDNWDAPTELTFLVIVDHRPGPGELQEWEAAAKQLEERAKLEGWPEAEFRIVTYDEISARQYRESDRLDWDGLSDAA